MTPESTLSSTSRWKVLLPWSISGLILWLLLRHFDFSVFWSVLHASRWLDVLLAALLNLFFITLFRTLRFHVLISELPGKIRFGELLSILMASRALNILLPARAGETLRTLQLCRRHHYPLNGTVTAIAMETSLEAIALSLTAVAIITTGFLPGVFEKLLYPLLIAGAIGLTLAFSLTRFKIGRFAAHRTIWVKSFAWTWLADFVDFLMIGLCLNAVGIHMGHTLPIAFIHWFLILAMINVAIILPTPGNLGTLEAGAVFALHLLGIPKGAALAFAFLYHTAHLLPITLLGSASLHSQMRNFRRAACSTTSPCTENFFGQNSP